MYTPNYKFSWTDPTHRQASALSSWPTVMCTPSRHRRLVLAYDSCGSERAVIILAGGSGDAQRLPSRVIMHMLQQRA